MTTFRRRRVSLLVAPLLLSAAAVHGQEHGQSGWRPHVALGAAYPVEDRWTGVASLGAERDWRDWHGGRLSLDLSVFGIRGRRDTRPHLHDDTQALAVGLRWRRGGWLLGFAPALATARTDTVSGTLQFVSTGGYQWRRWALLLQHLSNASTNGRNIGETMLMLEWRFGPSDAVSAG